MKPVLKYQGAKWNLAKWIISHFPPHRTYLEPFSGSAAVLFNKKPSVVETINDIDGNVVNFFKVLRERRDELAEVIEFTPYAREEYESIQASCADETYFFRTGDELEDARRFLIRPWQSRGSKTSDRNSWRHDIQGRGARCPSEWLRLPSIIREAGLRLKHVQIENQPAVKLISRYAFPEVLIYADPPYVLSTRNQRIYAHEMTDQDHIELLNALGSHPGPVILSGYACGLYDKRLKHWERVATKALAEKGQTREEVLWLNPVCAEANRNLFTTAK